MMGWITKLAGSVTGNPMLLVWIAAAALALGTVSGGGVAWKVQGWRLDSLRAEYSLFKGQVEANGKIAEANTKAKETQDASNTTEANHENTDTRAATVATISRVRQSADSSGGFVPKRSNPTGSAEAACLDRAGVERATGEFYSGLEAAIEGHVATARTIADKGTAAVVDLNTGRKWAATLGKPSP